MHLTQESIFVSAIRTFCKSFAALLGIFFAIIIGLFASFFLSSPNFQPLNAEVEIAADAEGNRTLLPPTTPAILRIDLHGVIGEGDLSSSSFEDILLDSREGFLGHDRIKGVFLHINTPGGTVTDADGIYRALLQYKKKYQVPLYAYVDGLCASGGMYIASACDKIYASPSSTIGSVGVILGPAFNFSQAMEKWGIQSLTLTQGKDKDMLNPFRPWVPGEDESIRNILAALYERFVTIVTTARPQLSKERLIETYGAQVYVAAEAQKLGYIDQADSSYHEALHALVKAAGIEDQKPYQVAMLKRPKSFVKELFDGSHNLLKGQVTHRFEFSPYMTSDMSGKFLYLYQPVP